MYPYSPNVPILLIFPYSQCTYIPNAPIFLMLPYFQRTNVSNVPILSMFPYSQYNYIINISILPVFSYPQCSHTTNVPIILFLYSAPMFPNSKRSHTFLCTHTPKPSHTPNVLILPMYLYSQYSHIFNVSIFLIVRVRFIRLNFAV